MGQFQNTKSEMCNKNCFIFLLLLPLISSRAQVNFDTTSEDDFEGSGPTGSTDSFKSNGTAGCSVATSESTGLRQYIYIMREKLQPSKTTTSCKTQDSGCNALQCCFSEASTSVRPGFAGTCILNDWVLPVAGGLVLALFFSFCLCCCCCCCSRKKKQEYDL